MNTPLPSHDTLSLLAKEDPERLEQLRAGWIEELISSAPEDMRRRLRGLQFQIDSHRRLHTNPLGACVEISKMMYDSLSRLNKLIHDGEDVSTNRQSAKVLSFV